MHHIAHPMLFYTMDAFEVAVVTTACLFVLEATGVLSVTSHLTAEWRRTRIALQVVGFVCSLLVATAALNAFIDHRSGVECR